MKVLYVTNKIPIYRKKLYERLGKKIELTIAHYGNSSSSKFYNERIIETSTGRLFTKIKTKIDYDNFDVVIIWGNLRLFEVYKLTLKRKRKFKLILFGPGVSASYTKKYDSDKVVSIIYKKLIKKADAAIFYDNYPVIKYSSLNVLPDKLFSAPNTVDIDNSNVDISNKRSSFMFFGTLYKEKGTDVLLKAYKTLKERRGTELPKLNILGDGPEFQSLRNWVKLNELDAQIKFYGRVTDKNEIEKYFSKAIACISPRQAGLSVVESMAYGVPFVTSKYPITGGEYTAIVEGANGYFFDGSVKGLVKTLENIIESANQFNLNQNCIEYYNRFRSPELWVNQVLKALDFVLHDVEVVQKYKSNIAFFTNIAPHYREVLWLTLLSNPNFDIKIFFGESKNPSILPINFNKPNWKPYHHRLIKVKNYKLGSRLILQSGVFNQITKRHLDAVILLGDANIISNWVIALLARVKKIPVIFWGHGLYGNEKSFKKWIRKQFLKLADYNLVYGHWAKNLLIKEGFDENTLIVIYNSVNYEISKPLRRPAIQPDFYHNFFKNTLPTLIFIGRLTKVKKLNLLIEALHKLNAEEKRYNLILVGDGEARRKLERLAQSLELDVLFYGECYDENQISKLMANADLCVSPGNVGLTSVHAMSYGTPVCTTNDFINQGPEFEAIKAWKTGCFFDQRKNNLAETISKWFGKKHDREKIRLACYNVIDTYYNSQVQLAVLKEVLDEVIKK